MGGGVLAFGFALVEMDEGFGLEAVDRDVVDRDWGFEAAWKVDVVLGFGFRAGELAERYPGFGGWADR